MFCIILLFSQDYFICLCVLCVYVYVYTNMHMFLRKSRDVTGYPVARITGCCELWKVPVWLQEPEFRSSAREGCFLSAEPHL